jgi:D-serine deaminase-like pyridoxal phosphate-dependent protein
MIEAIDSVGDLPQLQALQRRDQKLATPALIVHADIARRNVDRYGDLARGHGVKLRPHAKTHRSDVLAGWQRDAGCSGLTVGTFQEAEYFLRAGHKDLFVACPPVGAAREQVLAGLSREGEIIVSVDSLEALASADQVGRSAGRPVRYYWEMDSGFARYGTTAGEATVTAVLAAQRFRHTGFAGLMSFGGGAYRVSDASQVPQVSRAEAALTVATADMISRSGVEVPEISMGSTPSAETVLSVPGVTELRAGTYIFNDATQVALGSAVLPDCSQTICTTVMSTPPDGRIVVDAGSKALPKEQLCELTTGFGIVLGYPGLLIERVSEEAGVMTWAVADHMDPPRVGDKLQIVSNHSCSATHLFSHFWLIGEDVFDRLPIGARIR